MAKRSLLRRALGRGHEVPAEAERNAWFAQAMRAAVEGEGAPAKDAEDRSPGDGGETQGPERPPGGPLAEFFAALRRGETPADGEHGPPDTARADQLLAELDRVWRSPRT